VTKTPRPHFLQRLSLVPERVPSFAQWPYSIPFVQNLALKFESAVTFFVGENGSGKSTLIEAIADICDLPVSGGGKNEAAARHGPEQRSPLAHALRPAFTARPRDSYFFRAEFQAHLASLLDQRRQDPDFWEDPYVRYGNKSLHTRSHGEAFLALLLNRLTDGLFLLDEPESALSPQHQLTLLAKMDALVRTGSAQFIVATHSPILLTFPDAQILSFDGECVRPTRLECTSHYQITKAALDDPGRLWDKLRAGEER
jgi:predicted ATPase